MPRSLAALAAFVAVGLAGCGGADEPAPPLSDKLTAPLVWTRDGDRQHQEVTIEPNGTGTVIITGSGATEAAFKLDSSEFKHIAELTSQADIGSLDSPDHDEEAKYTFSLTYGPDKVTWDEEQRPKALDQVTSRIFDVQRRYN